MGDDTRKKNTNWQINLPLSGYYSLDQAQLAVLMDIRDELQTLNNVFRCNNFLNIPHVLARISRNTHKPKKRRRKPMEVHS